MDVRAGCQSFGSEVKQPHNTHRTGCLFWRENIMTVLLCVDRLAVLPMDAGAVKRKVVGDVVMFVQIVFGVQSICLCLSLALIFLVSATR